MSFAAGTPLHGSGLQGLQVRNVHAKLGSRGSHIASRTTATLSRDRPRVQESDAEIHRLESIDAFAELQKLANKQSVNRPQDVRLKFT